MIKSLMSSKRASAFKKSAVDKQLFWVALLNQVQILINLAEEEKIMRWVYILKQVGLYIPDLART